MKEILVDANVLISLLTDRDPEQQEKAAALFQAAIEKEHVLALHVISISETVYVLRNLYKFDATEISLALSRLLALPGVVSVGEVVWSVFFELWPQTVPTFGDAILAATASQERYDAVATFDRPLRKKLAKQGTVSYWSD